MVKHVKYPRTKHLPWSGSSTKDDRFLESTACFQGKDVIVTVKCDGENTGLYLDGSFHARSLESKAHASRSWLHKWWHGVCFSPTCVDFFADRYPEAEGNIRFYGENLCATHTLQYNNLKHWFYLHSVWLGDTCLDWDTTTDIADRLGITTVPFFYGGIYDELVIRQLGDNLTEMCGDPVEGYVVRLADSFTLENFPNSVAKYVHPDFKLGEQHWSLQEVNYNGRQTHS